MNASPSQAGMISGQSEPTNSKPIALPSLAHITYSGTTVTCGGSINETRTTRKTASRPRQRSFESA